MSKKAKRIYTVLGIAIILLFFALFISFVISHNFLKIKLILSSLLFNLVLIYASILGSHLFFCKQKKHLDSNIQFLNDITNQIIKVLLNVIEAKDEYTKGHSVRVAKISRELGKRLGYSKNGLRDLYYIALLHDIGKIKISDTVLKKNGHLTDDEYEQIKKHTIYAAKMFKDFTVIEDVCEGMLYHHEKYDGTGYPSHLSGNKIPLSARIIAVADAFDTMNTKRCYRAELPKSTILKELRNGSGTQFDPQVIKVMLDFLNEHPYIFNNF